MSLNPLPWITSAFGGIQTYLIVGAVTAAVAGAGGAYAGYRWEHGEVLKLQLADAQFKAAAVAAARVADALQYRVILKAATDEAYAQGKLQAQTITITKEIPAHVTPHEDRIVCIPVGLARIMRGASDGSDPDSLSLAAGQSDDDCSDLTATEMAGWFTAYAGASRANAEQLNTLIAEVRAIHDAEESVK